MSAKQAVAVSVLAILFVLPARESAGTVVFGPQIYEREKGTPVTISETFAENLGPCEPASEYELIIMNGDEDGDRRVSSATLTLNGNPVAVPNEFNQNVAEIRKPVTLGDQNTLEVELNGKPGGILSVAIECVANCFDVKITDPMAGETIHQDRTWVEGRIYSSSPEVGVRAGGILGAVAGPPFSYAVPNVPLQAGSNTLTVMATNTCGMEATASVDVNVGEAIEPKVILLHNPENGIAPLDVSLKAIAVPPNPVKGYAWNYSDDTVSETTVTFDTPGLYFPEVTVTDAEDLTYTASVVVNVWDKEAMNARLQEKWEGMRLALSDGNSEAALIFFSHGSRDKYGQIFEALGDEIVEVGNTLGEMERVEFRSTSAKYRIQREEIVDGLPMTLTFWVYFIQDGDGIWRIRQF